MARSPLSRNRTFERVAIPLLIILFVTVAVRQLRKVFRHGHEHRIERVHHGHHAHRHEHETRRELRHRHRNATREIERNVEVMVQVD
ncbi:hypothetical protein [Rubrivirga sp. IMCC43871]|uniref:hypothetical protein n=1 Tax=Rubrivirga sp. IMCC43871 TaxID=3391575 RepID=UPI00398FD5B1